MSPKRKAKLNEINRFHSTPLFCVINDLKQLFNKIVNVHLEPNCLLVNLFWEESIISVDRNIASLRIIVSLLTEWIFDNSGRIVTDA